MAKPPLLVEEALLGLPPRTSDSASGPCLLVRSEEEDRRYRRYLSKFDLLSETRVVYNHGVRYHNESDLELYDTLRPGEDSVDAVERSLTDTEHKIPFREQAMGPVVSDRGSVVGVGQRRTKRRKTVRESGIVLCVVIVDVAVQ